MNPTRREFLQASITAGVSMGVAGSAAAAQPQPAAPAERKLDLLILGGTSFLGPHVVEAALARGHTMTLFNRGRTNPHLFPKLEKLRGDRDPRKGEALYVICKACHGPDGAGIRAMNAPRLKGTSDWYLLTTLEKFKAGIRGGVGSSPNSVLMRGMALSLADEQAIKDVIAYVQTLGDGLADDAAARASR